MDLRINKNNLSTTSIFDKLISGIIFIVFLVCPIFFTGLTAQDLGFEKMMLFYSLTMLATVLWLAKAIIIGELKLTRTPLDKPIIALTAFLIISSLLSVNKLNSLIGSYNNIGKGLISYLMFVVFYYLLVNNIDTKKMKVYFWTLVTSASLTAIYAILQMNHVYLLRWLPFTKSDSFNPISSAVSSLSSFMIIAFPLLVIGFTQFSEITKIKDKTKMIAFRIVLAVATICALAVMAMTNQFTYWSAAIVSIFFILIFSLSKVVKIESKNIVVPIISFLLLVMFIVIGDFTIKRVNLPTEISLSHGVSWQIAKSSLKESPVFGSGPSTFDYSFGKFKGKEFNNSPLWNARFDSANGSFFEMLADLGLLGTLLVVIVLLIALSTSFISATKSTDTSAQSINLALFASLISAFILASVLTINNSLVLIFGLLGSLAVASATIIVEDKQIFNLSLRVSTKYALALATIFLTASAAVIVLFVMGAKLYLADIYAKKAMAETDSNKQIELLNKVINLAGYRDTYNLTMADAYMRLANQEMTGDKNQEIIRQSLDAAIKLGKKSAEEINPKSGGNTEALAVIYENTALYTKDALDFAINYHNETKSLEPDSPLPDVKIALVKMALAKNSDKQDDKIRYTNEAIKAYQDAIMKKADLAIAYYGEAVANEQLENGNDEAIKLLGLATQYAPDNATYAFEYGRLLFNRGVSSASADGIVTKNADLLTAEQIFVNILKSDPNNANALYSLALLYKKVGDNTSAKNLVNSLLNILTDEEQKTNVRTQFADIL